MALEYILLIAQGPPDSTGFIALLEEDVPNSAETDLVEAAAGVPTVEVAEASSFESSAETFIDDTVEDGVFESFLEQDVPNTAEADEVTSSEAAHSNDLSVTLLGTISPPPPAAPLGLAAVGEDLNIDLTWNASPFASSYSIYRSLVPGGPYTLIASGNVDLDYTDGALINGTTYYYVVTADGLGGESAYSNEAFATPQPTPPGAPTSLMAAGQIANIALSWVAPAINVPGYGYDYGGQSYGGGSANPATSYNMYRGTVPGGPYFILASGLPGLTHNDPSAIPGTPYYYVVRGVNAGGEGPNSNEATATALPSPVAPPPIEFEVIVMWDPINQTLSVFADISSWPGKSVVEMTAFPGTTDITPLLANVGDPKILFIQAISHPIKIDVGPGFPVVTNGKVYMINLEQGAPPFLRVSAVDETDILVICAGNP
jgi:hypothetical protein